VFTPSQLDQILSSPALRDGATGFRSYFDDNNVSGETLNLDNSSWNAILQNFEGVPHLGIAAPRALNSLTTSNDDNVISLDTWVPNGVLPALAAGQSGDGNANLVVGTAGGQTLSGLGGNDVLAAFNGGAGSTLNGGAANDLLLGGPGNDTLSGNTGRDVLAGGLGADIFKWLANAATEAPGSANMDTVVDYSFLEGDRLDLSALLDANFGPTSDVSNFVQAS
jgi:Ca2+-binding RTX toxin-like protein